MHLSKPAEQTHYRVRLYRDGKGATKLVHKLVAEAFIGDCPPGMEVCHGDGNYLNNRASNLSYGTHSQNMQDMVRHGTSYSANKTHCPKGHEYTAQNTVILTHRGGSFRGRACRECLNALRRKRRSRGQGVAA
jgi:HNH endonuclease